MFSQIAQVFSSSGVVIPGRECGPVYGKPKGQIAGDPNGSGSGFDQASAKLEISRQGQDKQAEEARSGKADGRRYAVGGHVEIDAGQVQGNPGATLAKAQMAVQAQKESARDAAVKQNGGEQNGTGTETKADDGVRSPEAFPDPRSAYGRKAPQAGAALSIYA